jgi:adenylosuccinate lyase
MELQSLTAISPIDGRYRNQLQHLDAYFSEYALIQHRIEVEIAYFLFLSERKFFTLTAAEKKALTAIFQRCTADQAIVVKNLEKVTNHDVKAVEYFIKAEMEKLGLTHLKEWVHFGLTSQDINNTAIPLSWKRAIENEYMPAISNLILHLTSLASAWKKIPMLARTHGQPASPTTLGKEIMVFVERLSNQLNRLAEMPTNAKFGGATGNFNAHHAAFPKTDWIAFGNAFVQNKLGLKRQQHTTQIEHYDGLAEQMDAIKRINTILIDLCRDVWTYISMDYFGQKIKKGEVGSSAMPHKVNPIDFENAEGNLGIANALWEHLSAKLPVSRLQRDLTDSTVLRNLGVPFAHSILSLMSIEKGLHKLILRKDKLEEDLEQNWAVVTEAIQTILRRENYPNPYEALKELSRGNAAIDQKAIHRFIDALKISTALKKELKKISPQHYTGIQGKFIGS